MDQQRFDALTRTLAMTTSRRDALRRAGLAGIAGLVASTFGRSRAVEAAAGCNYIGCPCSSGTRNPCGGGLVCCPDNPGLPGSAGVCASPGDCGGTCVGLGGGCPAYCNWTDSCSGCCSGYCGFGTCDTFSCTGLGCSCTTGTFAPCDDGLVCCSLYPGLPGSAGVCQYGCG